MNVSQAAKLASTNRQTALHESKPKITPTNLIRWSGLSAMAAGAIFAVIQPIHPPDVLASVTTQRLPDHHFLQDGDVPLRSVWHCGLYARQVKETGWLGLAGYLLLTIFYAVQMCFAFVEPLILPLLVTESPKFVESVLLIPSGAGGPMNVGALATVYALLSIVYLLGLLLFGIAIFRARILSRWAAILLALSGPVAAVMSQLGHPIDRVAAVPMGIALAWLGYSLWSERRAPAAQPVADTGSARLNPTAE